MIPGQGRDMHRLPVQAPLSTLPWSSTMVGSTPKNGSVAEPGFWSMAPGSGVVRITPGVLRADVEDQLVGERGVDQVAGSGVHHALRLPGRAAGVEDEERVLGVHRLGGALRRNVLHLVVPPVVAPFRPGDVLAGALEHD